MTLPRIHLRAKDRVPIAELEQARAQADAMFPGLVHAATWTPGSGPSDICVEFKLADGGRKVVPWANGGPA